MVRGYPGLQITITTVQDGHWSATRRCPTKKRCRIFSGDKVQITHRDHQNICIHVSQHFSTTITHNVDRDVNLHVRQRVNRHITPQVTGKYFNHYFNDGFNPNISQHVDRHTRTYNFIEIHCSVNLLHMLFLSQGLRLELSFTVVVEVYIIFKMFVS